MANRVAKILDNTVPQQWRHVPTRDNPADNVSRGMTTKELVASKRWLQGPAFLLEDEVEWPLQMNLDIQPNKVMTEERDEVKVFTAAASHEKSLTDRLINYFSSWHRLQKVTAWILRFKAYLLKMEVSTDPITATELNAAEKAIITYVQKQYLPDLSAGGPLRKLSPIKLSDGLWRVGGQLEKSAIDNEARHPALLPAGHHVTQLIEYNAQARLGHSGVERVLADIRQRYWLVKGRTTVRRVLSTCILCKKDRARTEIQKMADLPRDRLTPGKPPFTFTGVDYFGPLIVRRGCSEVKRYGCLFTCLSTRAIHIEVSTSLETDAFINCLFRFIALIGRPEEIRSNNGTNFVGAKTELKLAMQEWNQTKIHDAMLQKEIAWLFNPPGASHLGGVWERQIHTVRTILNALVQQQRIDEDSLHTLLCEVESIVNSRPITKLSDDPRDPYPLTPNHLLQMSSGPVVPPGCFVKQDAYRRRWRQVQYLADVFWSRWLKEYLPGLQERQRWTATTRNIAVGDLVLVKNESMPRNH